MNDRFFALLRMIERDLYSFLKNAPHGLLAQIGTHLSLSPEQTSALKELRFLARTGPRDTFENALSVLRQTRINSDPLNMLRLVKAHRFDKAEEKAQFRYARLLQDKRVVLVGPSKSVVGSGMGPEIEQYDLVVRLNFQWPVPPDLVADVGERMDILYHCCNGDFPVSNLFTADFVGTRFVCWERNMESFFLQAFCIRNNIPSMDISYTFKHLARRLNTLPNTGTLAIAHLLEFGLKTLFITGITFFQEAYYDGYQGKGNMLKKSSAANGSATRTGDHAVSPQLRFFKTLYDRDRRIGIDSVLARIVRAL